MVFLSKQLEQTEAVCGDTKWSNVFAVEEGRGSRAQVSVRRPTWNPGSWLRRVGKAPDLLGQRFPYLRDGAVSLLCSQRSNSKKVNFTQSDPRLPSIKERAK